MAKLVRVTTAPISLNVLLPGQMRFMQEHGYEVVMVSSDGPELKMVKEREGCRHHIIPMTRRMTPLGDIRCLWLLYRFFKKEKPDIVHSHTPKAGLLAMLAAKFAGVKLRIHTVAGLRFVTTKGFSRFLLTRMEKLTGRAATHVWPNSFSLEKYIKKHKLVRAKKLEVIGKGSSNGVNLLRYSISALQKNKLDEVKQKIKYEERLVYFLSVGRIVHDKGMDELLEAFIHIYLDNPDTRLILVGSFEDEVDPVNSKTRGLIHSHPGVIMAGWSDVAEYYMSLSFALIHPSHREGLPNVILQAGAMSCPVICSNIDGNIDIIEHMKTGLIFEVNSDKDLFSKMDFALKNKEEIKRFASALRKQVEEFYDQPVLHNLLLQRYDELLSSKSPNKN
ncbi:MAG TPA: glycosyltransferase family 4 protein [Chitinophagaceae bacterium]|nr:glycosyltransferase family 4 protein [Chitinophagaceae bacterium]